MALTSSHPGLPQRVLILVALALGLAAACGESSSEEPGQTSVAGGQTGQGACLTGDTRECIGPGACKGGQACKADGSGFEPCVCSGSGGASGSSAGGSGQGGSSGVCIPGKQEVCPCPGGNQGVQACKADGSGFDLCVCSGAGGNGTAGSGTSGQGGSGEAGSGTAGSGEAGSGTAGSGTAGSGAGGSGGSGQAGSGTAGSGTAGSGTAGSGTAGSGTAGSAGQAGSGSGGGASCGNGVKEASEACDGGDLGGQSCQSQGFDGGNLSCATCALDTSSCCLDACPFDGDTQCSGNSQKTCSKGATGCLSWSPPSTCGASGCAGKVCANQTCGNNAAEGSEPCDGSDLKGQTCQSQGFDGGTLACSNCSINQSGCCANNCSAAGQTQCKGNDIYVCNPGPCLYLAFLQTCPLGCSNGACVCLPNCANKCGGSDGCGGLCSGSCPNGQSCLQTNSCGCPSTKNGQFTVLSANSGPGCTSAGGESLKAFAEVISTNNVRFTVTKSDNTVFAKNATLSVYEGAGPTCPNPANAVKKTADVVVGFSQQTIDFVVNPYPGTWGLDEVKQFWIGVDESGLQSVRATGVMTIQRTCVP